MKLKAIETHYQGYRFRSRIEARWSVFFDAVGVKWEYEKEGYDLEGTWYLPDFWLPEQDCFIEIKGRDITASDQNKAELLALYTGKKVFTLSGNVGVSSQGDEYKGYGHYPPALWKCATDDYFGGPTTERVQVPYEMLILRERVGRSCLGVTLEDEGLVFVPRDYPWKFDEIEEYQKTVQSQVQVLSELASLLKDREQEILDTFLPDEGWDYDFAYLRTFGGMRWMECTLCGEIMMQRGLDGPHCEQSQVAHVNTPRLLKAYTAARSARFEHGEKPVLPGKENQ